MSTRYKLRLGDGSIRLVDGDELRAWLGDGNAMVQTPGSYRWSPLREFVTEEPALAVVPPKPGEGQPSSDPAVLPPSDRVARPSRGEPTAVQALADDTGAASTADVGRRQTDAHAFPTIRLKPLDDRDEEPAAAGGGSGAVEDEHEGEAVAHPPWPDRLAQGLLSMVAAFGTFLGRSLDRLSDRQDHARPRVPPTAPAQTSATRLSPTEPLRPPPPTAELPVLRFADVPEPSKAQNLYEGGGEEGVGFQISWLWIKRGAVIIGLVAGGTLGVVTSETWLPKLARVGQMMFTETARDVPSQVEMEAQQRALRAATERLPQLAPETIQLLLSSSPGDVLDPPTLFQLANDAADRGRSTLTPAEAKELKTLQGELVRSLRPAERRRVREYDRARSSRFVFPSESRLVLELSARGARGMPPRRRERLQVLLGKAISAGLVRPWDTAIR